MFTTIAAVGGNVIAGWLWRRVQEVGGWLAVVLPIFLALPPEYQGLVIAILSGQGGAQSIMAYAGFAVYLFSQIQSAVSTFKPHVVIRGRKVPILTEEQAKDVEEAATGIRPAHIPHR